MAIGRSARTIELIDVRTGAEILSLSSPDPRRVIDLCFSPDDGLLAAGCMGLVIQVWDLRHLRRELAAMGLDWDRPSTPGR